MGSSVLVSLEEYLQTTYRPDCDYIDGEVRERNVGEQPHGHLQMIMGGIFREKRKAWGVRPLAGQRIQVRSRRYRVSDVCVIRNTDPKDPIIAFPPLLCVEVLSSEDKFSELQERVDDYAQMGVENIWAIDPWKRHGYYAGSRGFEQPVDGVLRIAGTPIAISLAEVFAELDEF